MKATTLDRVLNSNNSVLLADMRAAVAFQMDDRASLRKLTPEQLATLAEIARLVSNYSCDCGMVRKGQAHKCNAQGGKFLKSTRNK